MNTQLKYMPIIRGRQQEIIVVKSFDFETRIYPCLEIVKELIRLSPKPRLGSKKVSKPKERSFEKDYLPLVTAIKAEKVFIDIPVHFDIPRVGKMKEEALSFLLTVAGNRATRTEYIKKFAPLAHKVIPVISTYYNRTNERGSITLQEEALRTDFEIIAFRVFQDSFSRDIPQIEAVLRETDYIIMDWQDLELDINDEDQQEIIEKLKVLRCNIIIHRNHFPNTITISGLKHDQVIDDIDNSLLNKYKDFNGECFSDYAGIKKDKITDGGTTSPGFVYYDAVNNEFYGYRYEHGGHKKDEVKPKIDEFESRIVPSVISSNASKRMLAHGLDYLSIQNQGWRILQNINNGKESGKIAAKFKRIGLEHYLHCMKTRISNGDFD